MTAVDVVQGPAERPVPVQQRLQLGRVRYRSDEGSATVVVLV